MSTLAIVLFAVSIGTTLGIYMVPTLRDVTRYNNIVFGEKEKKEKKNKDVK